MERDFGEWPVNEELASVAFEYDSVRHAAFVTLEAETCMRSAYLLETLVNMARERLLSELRDGNIGQLNSRSICLSTSIRVLLQYSFVPKPKWRLFLCEKGRWRT